MSDNCIPKIADIYPVESLPKGWMTAQVTFRRRNGREETRLEIIHLKSSKRYLHEPLRLTSCKCFEIFSFFPFYSSIYFAWNLIRIPTTIFCSVRDQSEMLFQSQTLGEMISKLFDIAWTGLDAAIHGIWTIVRAPFYLIQMFFGALVGIFFPLQGRQILEVEMQLHQKTIRSDFLRHPIAGETDRDAICKSLKEVNNSNTVFIAHCMQPLGKVTDPNVILVQPMRVQ